MGSDMKRRYQVQVRGTLPADLAQRVGRMHAMAILQSRRGHAAVDGFQATESRSPRESQPAEQDSAGIPPHMG